MRIDVGHINQIARRQLDLFEGFGVAPHVAFGFSAAVDQIEGKAGNPAFGQCPQIIDRGGAIKSHQIDQPPSMAKACPVVKADRSPAR